MGSTRYLTSSSWNLVNNYEGIHEISCKYRHYDKKLKTCGIKYKYCQCYLEYTYGIDGLIQCKCLCCN